jgi:hypothetical protein
MVTGAVAVFLILRPDKMLTQKQYTHLYPQVMALSYWEIKQYIQACLPL